MFHAQHRFSPSRGSAHCRARRASAPAFAQHKVVVDGNLWLACTPETRRVFLIGAANMIALESAYSKRKGTPLPTVSAMTVKAVDGMTLDQISERITRWYGRRHGHRRRHRNDGGHPLMSGARLR